MRVPMASLERSDPAAPQHIGGPCLRAMCGNHRKQARHSRPRLFRRDRAKRRGRCAVACDRKMKQRAVCGGAGPDSDVRVEGIKVKLAAAIHDHRQFRRERQRGRCDGVAQLCGQRVRIDQGSGIARQRIGEDWHAVADIESERRDRSGE